MMIKYDRVKIGGKNHKKNLIVRSILNNNQNNRHQIWQKEKNIKKW